MAIGSCAELLKGHVSRLAAGKPWDPRCVAVGTGQGEDRGDTAGSRVRGGKSSAQRKKLGRSLLERLRDRRAGWGGASRGEAAASRSASSMR